MQVSLNFDGAVQRDRAASGAIILEALGALLWTAEVTADDHV